MLLFFLFRISFVVDSNLFRCFAAAAAVAAADSSSDSARQSWELEIQIRFLLSSLRIYISLIFK